MKKLIALFFVFILFSACTSHDNLSDKDKKEVGELDSLVRIEGYEKARVYYERSYIPDSLRPQMAKFITEAISAASLNLTAGDYEDPEDLLNQAEKTAEKIFSRRTASLCMKGYDMYVLEVPTDKLTPRQWRIHELIIKHGPVK